MTTRSCPLALTADSTLGRLCYIPFTGVSAFPYLFLLSLCLFLLFHVFRYLVFEGISNDPSHLDFALRMIYANNPQSYQLTRNTIVLRLHASGPTAWPCFLFVVTPFVFFSVTFVRFRPSHSLLSIFAQIPVSRGAFPLFCKALLRK
jgi:hypothetical protein